MKAGRMTYLFVLLPLIAIEPLRHAFGLLPVLGYLFIAMMLTGRHSQRLSRNLEQRADKLALEQPCGPTTLARALERICMANLAPVVEPGKGLTHPHLYDRLVAAGAPPEYARPAPPSTKRVQLTFSCSMLVICGLWFGILIGHIPQDHFLNLLSTAISNGSENDLSRLAYSAWKNQRFEECLAFYRAASETNLTRVDLPANVAITLAFLDRCDEAEVFAHEADRRLAAGGRGNRWQINDAWFAISGRRHNKQFQPKIVFPEQ
jgi:hypothetical protein